MQLAMDTDMKTLQKGSHPVSGRKPAQESRATEFRRRLIAWKQTPEASRPSLRALAREFGTSHQLLTFYLKGLGKWQGEESLRRAKEIRARVENRVLTPWEVQQAQDCDSSWYIPCCSTISSA